MKHTSFHRLFLLGTVAILAGAMAVTGCNKLSYPDEKSAATNSLKSSNLSSVTVSQDRDKGVITLKQKKEAEDLAKTVPNVQQVVNELEVEPNKHSTTNS